MMMLFLERARPARNHATTVAIVMAASLLIATAALGLAVYQALQVAVCHFSGPTAPLLEGAHD